MFRNVPECSGMFHVPGFIDALFERQFELKSIRKDPDSKIVTEVGRSKFSRRGNNLTMVVFTVEHK